MEAPLQQELVIEWEKGENIRLVFKYEKLGKFCFVCGTIGHLEIFCSDKFVAGSASSEKKWGAYFRAENNSIGGGHKEARKWIVGGRSKISSGRKEEGATINDHVFNFLQVYGMSKVRHDGFSEMVDGNQPY